MKRFDTVESTQILARQWAKDGATHGARVVAGTQTHGRGRLSRVWESKAGEGLWMTVILRPQLARFLWSVLSFAAAMAVQDACAALGIATSIKWPNDILIDGKKVCGILSEIDGDAVLVGIGVNANQSGFPPPLDVTAVSLAMTSGCKVQIDKLETLVVDALLGWSDRDDLLDAYRIRCATLGQSVIVHEGGNIWNGTAHDIDEHGALLVTDPTGALRAVHAGDVSIRGQA